MKRIKIKIPSSVKSCSLQQLGQWAKAAEGTHGDKGFETLNFRVNVVSIFSGVKPEVLRTISFKELCVIYFNIQKMLSNHEIAEPLEEIFVAGKAYKFNKDFTKITTGQVVDMKLLEDIHLNAARAMAILYVENGLKYSEPDEDGIIKNPTSIRADIFEKEFPGDVFLNMLDFFLRFYTKMNIASLTIQAAKMEIQKDQMMKTMKKDTKKALGRNGIFGPRISLRSRVRREKRSTK